MKTGTSRYFVDATIEREELLTRRGRDAEELAKIDDGTFEVFAVRARVVDLETGRVGIDSLSEIVIRPGDAEDEKYVANCLRDCVAGAAHEAGV